MTNDVHIGKDGWLFLVGGSNELIRYYTEPNFLTKLETDSWSDVLKTRSGRLESAGIIYRHFFVPDKLSIYPEYFDGDLPYFNRRPSALIAQNLAKNSFNVDITSALLSSKTGSKLYWKTDSHWTYQGCYFAYECLCQSLGVEPLIELKNRPFGDAELVLDLGGKLMPPVREVARFYSVLRDAKRTYTNGLVEEIERKRRQSIEGLLMLSSVGFRNKNRKSVDAKVMLFGDSYSEFRPHLLTGMLAETFREVSFYWSNSIDFRLIEKNRPDIVITENAERFVRRLPDDELDIVNAAEEKLALYLTKYGLTAVASA